jgi:hypothetical protein
MAVFAWRRTAQERARRVDRTENKTGKLQVWVHESGRGPHEHGLKNNVARVKSKAETG